MAENAAVKITTSQGSKDTADKDVGSATPNTATETKTRSGEQKSERYKHRIRASFRPKRTTMGNQRNQRQQQNNIDIVTAVKGLVTGLFSLEGSIIVAQDQTTQFSTLESFPATEAEFFKFFETGERTANGLINVYFTLTSTHKFGELKTDHGIWNYLQSNNVYLYTQSFAKVHEMTDIGILLFRHPKVTHKQHLITTLTKHMKEFLTEGTEEKFDNIQFGHKLEKDAATYHNLTSITR